MPFGPVLAIVVFACLCLRQQLVEAEKQRVAKAQKEKEAEKKKAFIADVIKSCMK